MFTLRPPYAVEIWKWCFVDSIVKNKLNVFCPHHDRVI